MKLKKLSFVLVLGLFICSASTPYAKADDKNSHENQKAQHKGHHEGKGDDKDDKDDEDCPHHKNKHCKGKHCNKGPISKSMKKAFESCEAAGIKEEQCAEQLAKHLESFKPSK